MSQDESHLAAAQNFIMNRMFTEALRTLEDIDDRTGRWYYLSAAANLGAGNQATAMEHIDRAIAMEPNNMEYKQMKQRMQGVKNEQVYILHQHFLSLYMFLRKIISTKIPSTGILRK